jgi:hypothetical protein
VACPYFFPTERTFAVGWPFPQRLPLGAGFCGSCRAAGQEFIPDETVLRDFCNLGHAHGCARMPSERSADSVRFAVSEDTGEKIRLLYVYDLAHAPGDYGQLEYDCVTRKWRAVLKDVCVQRQAECYLAMYLERRKR